MRQFTEARRQANAEKAEDKGPGAQRQDRAYQFRLHDFVVVGKGVVAGHNSDEHRCDDKPDDELWKTPPDLSRLRLLTGFLGLPLRRGNQRHHEGPNPNPHVAADDFHQGETPHSVIRRASNALHVTGEIPIGLRGGKAGGVRKLGGLL